MTCNLPSGSTDNAMLSFIFMIVLVCVLLFTSVQQLPMMLALLGIGAIYYKVSNVPPPVVNSVPIVRVTPSVRPQYHQSVPYLGSISTDDYSDDVSNVDDKHIEFMHHPKHDHPRRTPSSLLSKYHNSELESEETMPWFRTE